MLKKPIVYFDACIYNRPFDNQRQDRIRLETEAIIIILKYIRKGKIDLIGSDILLLEINKTANLIRKSKLNFLLKNISNYIITDIKTKKRAEFLKNKGFDNFDALHIANAEINDVNYFISTDDKLIKLYNRIKHQQIKVLNPINWLEGYMKK